MTLLTVYAEQDNLNAMTLSLSLTTVLTVFLLGFLLHRHASVRIAAVGCFVLGVLVSANPVVHSVVHTLDGVFSSVT